MPGTEQTAGAMMEQWAEDYGDGVWDSMIPALIAFCCEEGFKIPDKIEIRYIVSGEGTF